MTFQLKATLVSWNCWISRVAVLQKLPSYNLVILTTVKHSGGLMLADRIGGWVMFTPTHHPHPPLEPLVPESVHLPMPLSEQKSHLFQSWTMLWSVTFCFIFYHLRGQEPSLGFLLAPCAKQLLQWAGLKWPRGLHVVGLAPLLAPAKVLPAQLCGHPGTRL